MNSSRLAADTLTGLRVSNSRCAYSAWASRVATRSTVISRLASASRTARSASAVASAFATTSDFLPASNSFVPANSSWKRRSLACSPSTTACGTCSGGGLGGTNPIGVRSPVSAR
jgi:hypothetical protein